MTINIIIGIALALVCIFLGKKLFQKNTFELWSSGLIIAAIIYVVFAIIGKNWTWLPIELGGVLIYGFFIFLAKKYSVWYLALGWGLHVFWDLILHPNGHPSYVPEIYPALCLGFDLAIAGYLVLHFLNKKKHKIEVS